MSGSFEGINPPLVGSGGKSDDYPRFFTLNYAEILGFEPAHDPNHDHVGEAGAWGSDPLHALGAPEVVPELDRLDLVQTGPRGRPKGPQLLKQAHLQPDFIAIYYQNRHK